MKIIKKNITLIVSLLAIVVFTFPLPKAEAKVLEGVVNVNTASISQLILLPGIGQAKAKEIVEHRKVHPFSSLEDLKSLKGLGPKRLEALRPYVVFSGPTTARRISKKIPSSSVRPPSPVPSKGASS